MSRNPWVKKYGTLGKLKKPTSPFCFVRLKRIRARGFYDYEKHLYTKTSFIKVQQKGKNASNNTCWVTLGCFDTENEAVDVLEDTAEMIRFIWMIKEF